MVKEIMQIYTDSTTNLGKFMQSVLSSYGLNICR